LVDSDLGVLLPIKSEEDARPAVYSLGQERENEQDRAESDRLLYVAATRAREQLILSGCVAHDPSTNAENWLGRILQAHGMTWALAAPGPDAEEPVRVDLQLGQTAIACSLYGPGFRARIPLRQRREKAVAAVELPPPLLPEVRAIQESVDERTVQQESEPPQRVWRVVPAAKKPTAPAWVVGRVVHEALAIWRFPGPGFDRWASARAREHGITDLRQCHDATKRAEKLLWRFQAHPLCAEMEAAERRLHEVPYSLVVDGRQDRGAIDALYLGGDGWTIVEFKTDEVHDQSELDSLLETTDYVPQMNRYVDAVERLLGRRPRALLCWLDFIRKVHILDHHGLEAKVKRQV
jgi:ATP-dependent exoDNAse (exonuclease V) beta subunit